MKAPLKHLIIALILCPVFGLAQRAPGYLGKRFSVEYNAFVFPSFANPNSGKISDTESALTDVKPSINLQNYLVGQYSFSKRASLIGSFGFTKTSYIPVGYSSYDDPVYDQYPSMIAMSYNAGLRLFTQHYAPLGRYIEFRVGMAQVKNKDFTYSVFQSVGGTVNKSTHTIEGSSMWRPTIAIAWGTNRIIRDMVIVSYGLDINMFSGGIGYNKSLLTDAGRSEFDFDQGNTRNNQEELLNLAAGRYAMQCFINLRLGIGILL